MLPPARTPRFALVAFVALAGLLACLPALTRHSRRSGGAREVAPLSANPVGETGHELLIRFPLTVMQQLLVGGRP